MIHLEDLICEFSADQDLNEEKLTEQLEKLDIGTRSFIRWLVRKLDVEKDWSMFLEKENEELGGNWSEEKEYACHYEYGQ
jgi:hypothetical protein